ncbi:TPA: hypothetical protein J1021_004701, partial [Escherichia coli]|nr:hypothetical protein [Escherichia coli]
MIPVKVSSKKIRELAQKAKEILAAIDSGASEEDAFLKDMIDDWNSQVVCPCEFSDFRDYSSWTNANEFTRIAFNLEKFYEDFTWEELVQTISCVCDQKSNESEKIFALLLLEKNFHGNPSDLIFWPDEWFQDPDMLDVELSVEEIACYLMVRSGRQLVDAPEIDLKYQI